MIMGNFINVIQPSVLRLRYSHLAMDHFLALVDNYSCAYFTQHLSVLTPAD